MIYIILNKSDKTLVNDNMFTEGTEVTPTMVYPAFNPETMMMVYSDMAIQEIAPYYTNLIGHFNITQDGKLVEKSLTEKAQAGVLDFNPESIAASEECKAIEGKTQAIRIVLLGLQLKLLSSVKACDLALSLLDEETERRIAEQYSLARELKITKAYMAWVQAGKPEDAEGQATQEAYQTMERLIKLIKADYSAVRTLLKELIEPLKAAEKTATTEQETNAKHSE